jgi:hypothetical protein
LKRLRQKIGWADKENNYPVIRHFVAFLRTIDADAHWILREDRVRTAADFEPANNRGVALWNWF